MNKKIRPLSNTKRNQIKKLGKKTIQSVEKIAEECFSEYRIDAFCIISNMFDEYLKIVLKEENEKKIKKFTKISP